MQFHFNVNWSLRFFLSEINVSQRNDQVATRDNLTFVEATHQFADKITAIIRKQIMNKRFWLFFTLRHDRRKKNIGLRVES